MGNHLAFKANLTPSAAKGMTFDPERLDQDVTQEVSAYREFWSQVAHAPLPDPSGYEEQWLDVGAGSGGFFQSLAPRHPRTLFVAVERDKMRGKALEKRCRNQGPRNFVGIRGNIIPMAIRAFSPESLDRIYILYPCPWPKFGQRKNRWYLHPMMAPLFQALKPGGKLIWASDQHFYLQEAHYIFENHYAAHIVRWGELTPGPENGLTEFPEGRTNFERDFLEAGQPCWELIVEKPHLN